MITKNHSSAYSDLFKKAQEALSKYGSTEDFKNATINNIDDYFACLAELATIENDPNNNIDPIFTILPATEEVFAIDADKRSIKIPDNFAKYGVGVQGDEIAEIIYFAIDRYFDAVDLAEMDILIQWKHEKDNAAVNNLSATYKKSLTLIPGKIVFGWPITSEITERPGSVQFAVRFYNRVDNKLVYSFSTLTSTIKIQTGLNFDLSDDMTALAINKNTQIYNNLRNSKKANLDYVIATPEFIEQYYSGTNILDTTDNIVQFSELINADFNETYDLPTSFIIKAAVPSSSEDAIGSSGLDYKWYYKENINQDISEQIESKNVYIPVDISKPYNKNDFYYHLVDDVFEVYYQQNDDNPFDDEVELYGKYSTINPNKAGYYYAVAINRYAAGAVNSASSQTLVVPHPAEPTYTIENNIVRIPEGDESVEISIMASATDGGTLTYSWYKSEDNNYMNGSIIDGANSNEYLADEEGYYFLKALNKRNNSESKDVSNPIWVVHSPSSFSLKYQVNDSPFHSDGTASAIDINSTVSISVIFSNINNHSSNIIYEWYKDNQKIDGWNGNQYVLNETGTYYCKVTNTYKGESVVLNSLKFIIE